MQRREKRASDALQTDNIIHTGSSTDVHTYKLITHRYTTPPPRPHPRAPPTPAPPSPGLPPPAPPPPAPSPPPACCRGKKGESRTFKRQRAAQPWPSGYAARAHPEAAAVSNVAAGGGPTERRTESLLGNSRTEGHLLGPPVRKQTPNRTPLCSAPLLVCLMWRFLHCQELARVTALFMVVSEILKA